MSFSSCYPKVLFMNKKKRMMLRTGAKPFLLLPLASSVMEQHHPFREYRCLLFLAVKERAIYEPVASTITYFQEVFRAN